MAVYRNQGYIVQRERERLWDVFSGRMDKRKTKSS